MTAADQKKAKILGMLILISGLIWFLVYRLNPAVPASATSGQVAPAVKRKPVTLGDGSIRLDLLSESSAAGDAGSKNLFQYRPKPQPARPPTSPPAPVIFTPPPPPPPSGPPPPPPPPPFKTFRYESWIKRNGKIAAYISDGTNTSTSPSPAFYAVEGEVLMGQYKITRLTESTIEIEELTAPKRRQSFPKVVQQ